MSVLGDVSGRRPRGLTGPVFGALGGLRRRWSEARPLVAPRREEWPRALLRVRTAGLVILAIELVAFLWWSGLIAARYGLGWDYANGGQPAWLIAHGTLDPFATTLGYPIWRDHGFFLLWPLALLEWLWPHRVTLVWEQDLATVGAQAVALVWICDLAARRAVRDASAAAPAALAALGVVLLVLNPWFAMSISFDFHVEAFAMLFTVAAARDLHRGRRSAWLWFGAGLLCGDVAATYLAAVGLSGALSGRCYARRGISMMAAAVGWLVALELVHATMGSSPDKYASLLAGTGQASSSSAATAVVSAVVEHPGRALAALWANRFNVWANVSTAGLLGILWPPVAGTATLALAESQLSSTEFSQPGVQNIVLSPLVAVGTVAVVMILLGRSHRRLRWLPASLACLLVANAGGWTATWLPSLPGRWLTVPAPAAAVLRSVRRRIAPSDEVVAEQGIVGDLANRPFVYPVFGARAIPVRAGRVWFVFAPRAGIETASPSSIYSDIDALLSTPGVRLVTARDGIWALEWTPSGDRRRLSLTAPPGAPYPGWSLPGPAGQAVLSGPPRDWYVTGDGRAGYVADGAYWREPAGSYRANVSLSASSAATVELWNADTSTLLARVALPGTGGRTTVSLTGRLARVVAPYEFHGFGPWRDSPVIPSGDQLEVRVWSPGGADLVNVYSVSLRRVGGP